MNSQSTQPQQVLDLALRKGLLRSSDLDQINVSRVVLARMASAGQLEKVSRGLYRLPDSLSSRHESLLTLATKTPQAVFCLLSALQFHELTTQLPREVWLAMPRGSHAPKIDYPPIKMVQYSGAAFTEGVETVEVDQVQFRVYGVSKTIVDCFKHRNKIGIDVAIEALKEARRKKLIDMNALWHYATICRVANLMRPYLEATE
jgi:predicted transcriptional regulator of viral defense system